MSCSSTSTPPTPACNCPPSPTPPWHRPVQAGGVQTLVDSGTIDLNKDVTYLEQSVAGATPYAVTLPAGNHQRQIKRIYIPATHLQYEDVAWSVTGTFAGFTSVTFNSIGFSAVLEWDGTAWVLIGGNVEIAGNLV